ncbi:extracellular solute-binding protein [Salsipaludibacter albus]|uniref:extracellular solute-binding protein n=1 Tax=Salsipaludibacter albus TaxID=2849650 RepID=UPI0023680663|nr:extracellular solute-binding protein [Salsipaludibacter albus]MBY5163273.1 extracellular solute-binding protein [Salsipaludibacter albus]
MDVQMLGTLRVLEGGVELSLGGPRQQLVLAVLVQRAGTTVATSTVVDGVWGQRPPSTARKTAQVYVSRLRGQLGADRIVSEQGGYVLVLADEEVDAHRFEKLAERGRDRMASDPKGARTLLEEALGLWRGMPWGELGDEPVLQTDVVRLSEQRLVALEDRIEADLELGRARAIVGELEGLVAGRPLREGLRGHLMVALHQSGQSARALEVYEEGRRVLGDELGADPSPLLQGLHAQILRQDPGLAAPGGSRSVPSVGAVANPYRGLEPFRREDAALLHGRDGLVEEILVRLEEQRLVAVVGPSGSGKSSVVRAGVLPALDNASSDWEVATLVPGSDPFAALARALARVSPAGADDLLRAMNGDVLDVLRVVLATRHHRRLLLVVDQFEELFLVTDEAIRERFVRGLVEAVDDPASDVSVLVTLRADFLHRPLADPALGGRIRAGLVTVAPLSAAGVEQACTAPAATVGVNVEPELVAELVAAVTHQPGGLPLFQYALTQVFDERAGSLLTKSALDGLGGMQGILARRAEDVHDGLDEPQRALARQLFLRLVVLGEGAEDTRRRVPRRELGRLPAGRQAVDLVLERFGRARLVTLDRDDATGEPTVEVAHEALLEAWPRLRRWIDDARDDLRLHRALSTASASWEAADRHPDFLLTGARLIQFDDWQPESRVDTTVDEDAFLATSRAHRDDLARQEADRRDHEHALERRSVRRLRALVSVLVVALVIGAGLTTVALAQRRDARQAQGAALQAEGAANIAAELAHARELAATAVANRQRDPDLALNLAQHAVNIVALAGETVPTDVIAALHWALQSADAPYPDPHAPVAVLEGPDGPRGVFDVGPAATVAMAEAATARDLRPDECVEYFDDPSCPDLDTAEMAAVDWAPLETPGDPTRPLAGTTVRVLSNSDDELFAEHGIHAVLAATGIQVEYDFEFSFFDVALETGAIIEPDIDLGAVPQPGAAVELGRNGLLMDLSQWFDVSQLHRDLSEHLVAVASDGADNARATDDHVWGVPHELASKSLVWYPVPEFTEAGYEVPTTWSELEALVEQIQADGRTPWCHGEEDDEFSGWPGTDWIEEILLQTEGPETYDAWVAGELAFSDPPVRRAFERFNRLVLAPGRVWGGRDNAAERSHVDASKALLDDPPPCWLVHKGTFTYDIEDWGSDVASFAVPPLGEEATRRVLTGGDYFVALSDRPEVRAVLEFVMGPEWSNARLADGRFHLSPHRDVDTSLYADEARPVAEALRAAVADGNGVRFDGSDLMPAAVNDAFWDGMVTFVGDGPDNLDEVLAGIDAAWAGLDDRGQDRRG